MCAPACVRRQASTEARAQASLQSLGPLQPMALPHSSHVLCSCDAQGGCRTEQAYGEAAQRVCRQVCEKRAASVLRGRCRDASGPCPCVALVTCAVTALLQDSRSTQRLLA